MPWGSCQGPNKRFVEKESFMVSKRFYGAALMAAVVIPSTLVGCGDDASNPLCCNEF